MDNFWSSSNLLKVLFRWKWQILIITFLGMVIIGASTYLIEPKYQSKAIVYPVNLGAFSDENYTEQMMQILQSRDIKDSLISKFDLSHHYDIDSSYKHFTSVMYYELGQNIKVSRTQFEAVEIKVLDIDPKIATGMINTIIDCYDAKVRQMHAEKVKELLIVYEDKLALLQSVQDSITKRLDVLGLQYGIVNVESQSRELSAYLYSSSTGGERYKNAKKQMENLQKYGGEFTGLSIKLENLMEYLVELRANYSDKKVEYEKKISYHQLLTKPYPSDDKYSPKRIPITLLGGLSVFVLALLVIGIVENKRLNSRF